MFSDDRPKVSTLSLGVNLLRNEQKCYRLPHLRPDNYHIQDGDIVELLLLDAAQFSIESIENPMRYGKYYNNRLFFNTMTDQFSINPRFVFDGKKQVWTLMNAGYVCFAEFELEYKTNQKIYGDVNA